MPTIITLTPQSVLLQEHNDFMKTRAGLLRLIRTYNPSLSVQKAIALDRCYYLQNVE